MSLVKALALFLFVAVFFCPSQALGQTAAEYLTQGLACSDLENHEEAIADFTSALRIDPDYAAAYFNRGGAYRISGNHDEAIADFTSALRIDPDYAAAYYSRGFLYKVLGNHEEAIADFTRALRIDPDDFKAYYFRGTAKGALGLAYCADYKRACELGGGKACEWYSKQCKPSNERVSIVESSSALGDVLFNQVSKDVVVTTVAVLPIDGKNCNGDVIGGQDLASFTEGALLGIYNVVERRNLERVLEEQRLTLSGIVYEKSAVDAGCNVGAEGIIFTEHGCLAGQETIQLKLVDCATSELYWSATGINATAKETLDKVREELQKE